MSENLELDFGRRPPKVSVDEVEGLLAFLKGKGWLSAAEIERQIEIPERRLRRLCENADGAVLTGQKGYRLFDETVTLEEAEHAANWLISFGKANIRRGVAIRRRYHSFGRDQRVAS